jgi:CheY-like chemotaxis protein
VLFPAYTPSAEPSTGPQLQGTVLVIDDEETVLTVAASILETIGLKTLLANSGDAGITLFREKARDIDIILLDYTMPRMDGVRTHKELQTIRQDIPVLLMSGYNEQDAMAEFKDKDLAGFIQKPFNHELLYQKLAKTLNRRDGLL